MRNESEVFIVCSLSAEPSVQHVAADAEEPPLLPPPAPQFPFLTVDESPLRRVTRLSVLSPGTRLAPPQRFDETPHSQARFRQHERPRPSRRPLEQMTEAQLAAEVVPAITEVMGLTPAGGEFSTAELIEMVGAYNRRQEDEGGASPTATTSRSTGLISRVRCWIAAALTSVLLRARRALRSRELRADDDWGHGVWEKYASDAQRMRDHMRENAWTEVCAVCSQYKSAREMEGARALLSALGSALPLLSYPLASALPWP